MTAPIEPALLAVDRTASANGTASLSDRVKGLRLPTGQGAARSSGGAGWLPWLLCLLMAGTWASFGIRAYTTGGWKAILGGVGQQPAANAAPGDGAKKEKPVGAAATSAAPGEIVLAPKGNLVAARQIQVGPDRISGKVMKLYIVEGKHFTQGDPLAEIDKIDYESEYLQMKAGRAGMEAQLAEMKAGSRPAEKLQAQAQVEEAQAIYDQYTHDLVRYEELIKRGVQVSDKEVDTSRANVKMQAARVQQMKNNHSLVLEGPRKEKIAAMEAQLAQATAREKLAKEMLDRCVIRAPVTGIVLSKRTEIGNLVNPLAMNTSFNGGICEMADLTDMEVDLEIQERDIRKVRLNQDCMVQADAYPERRYFARVDRIMPVANRSLAIIPIRVKVQIPRDEEGMYLKPGMGVVATFYNRDAGPAGDVKPPVVEK